MWGGADLIFLGLRDIAVVYLLEYSLHIAVTAGVIAVAFWIMEDMPQERRVLVLKGLPFGIPELKYTDALKVASDIIQEKNITTVVWDGQKRTYPPNEKPNAEPAASFTRLIEMLFVKDRKERIEFMFFAYDEVAGEELLEGSEVGPDEHGNVVGPFPFLTKANVDIVRAGKASRPPRRRRGRHVGVVVGGGGGGASSPSSSPSSSSSSSSLSSSPFAASEEMLGLSGYRYLKEKLGVTKVNTLVLGMGDEISKEHARMAKEPELYPKLSVTEITVARSNKHHTIEEHEVAMF